MRSEHSETQQRVCSRGGGGSVQVESTAYPESKVNMTEA